MRMHGRTKAPPAYASTLFSAAFLLTSGGCQVTCHGRDYATCVCELRDNTGTINLQSIQQSIPATENGWWYEEPDTEGYFEYYYNPCFAFDECRAKQVALSRSSLDPGFGCDDVGTFESSRFSTEENGAVVIQYTSRDKLRNGTVHLLCDENQNSTAFRPLSAPWEQSFHIHFTLTGRDVCKTTTKRIMGAGTVVLFCLLAFLCFYLVIGVGLNIYRRKRRARKRSRDGEEGAEVQPPTQVDAIFTSEDDDIDQETRPLRTSASPNYSSVSDTSTTNSE